MAAAVAVLVALSLIVVVAVVAAACSLCVCARADSIRTDHVTTKIAFRFPDNRHNGNVGFNFFLSFRAQWFSKTWRMRVVG